jgi:hypothetical protein
MRYDDSGVFLAFIESLREVDNCGNSDVLSVLAEKIPFSYFGTPCLDGVHVFLPKEL